MLLGGVAIGLLSAGLRLELERAEVERLQTFNILDDALLGHLLLLGCPTSQNLLQALDLHQTLLDRGIVRIRLQHLQDDLELPILLLFIDLLLAQLARQDRWGLLLLLLFGVVVVITLGGGRLISLRWCYLHRSLE